MLKVLKLTKDAVSQKYYKLHQWSEKEWNGIYQPNVDHYNFRLVVS